MDLTLKKSAIRRKLFLVINLLVESLWEQFLEKKKKLSCSLVQNRSNLNHNPVKTI
jgi:hypothetical protein